MRSAPANPDASDASDAPDTEQVPDADSRPDADRGDAATDSDEAPDAPELDVGADAEAAEPPDAADCPVPRIRASIAGEDDWYRSTILTHPEETIVLSAGQSSGNITHYEWTILERPGSTQRLTPDNTSESTRLFVDRSGAYRIQLTVYDTSGAAICESSTNLTILATLDADLVITLLWITPNDPIQTDEFGSDMDLHYLHENGRWNADPWDVFWRNSTVDWGLSGDEGDPSLEIDDTNGAGPESITHSGLEDVKYSVGAYYYSDSGLGASYATVQIYVHGQLAYEKRNEYIPGTGYFWHVADIEDRGATITEVDALTNGFPDSP
ncbi:MAG: PKD domain-containing protein [Persicimonas sp.]